jgi:recombinational DNA repair protein RecR
MSSDAIVVPIEVMSCHSCGRILTNDVCILCSNQFDNGQTISCYETGRHSHTKCEE